MTHLALDTLHRYILNFRFLDEEPDWFLVGLACFVLASKVNSLHFGASDFVPDFYYKNRPRPKEDLFKSRELADSLS